MPADIFGAAAQALAAIRAYLAGTEYTQAVDPLQHSLAAFECWCDNRLMQAIRPQRYRYFTIEPLAAYILARRGESAMVRVILSAQANRLGDAVVRARWRQLYV